MMYAPTFRGGSQGIERSLQQSDHTPDYGQLVRALEKRFGGTWYIFLRLHPQLIVRHIEANVQDARLIDVSHVDDMYELLAGCDAFLTDYSSAAFDAAVAKMPIFLYADDYEEYEVERGKLLWDLRKLPFLLGTTDVELSNQVEAYNEYAYQKKLATLFINANVQEDGHACVRLVAKLKNYITSE